MPRKSYGEYSYIDPKEYYTYPDSNVLRNILGLRDKKEALHQEHFFVSQRLIDLGFTPIEVHSLDDICSIHHYLFQDMYFWAGDFRKVNISKDSNAFMAMQSFEQGTQFINSLLSNFHDTAFDRQMIVDQLALILDSLNYMHPFREGNGRTQREVIRSLAFSKGFYCEIDLDRDDKIFHLYMDGTVNSDTVKLKQLFDLLLEKID